jgi:hypothetical protein
MLSRFHRPVLCSKSQYDRSNTHIPFSIHRHPPMFSLPPLSPLPPLEVQTLTRGLLLPYYHRKIRVKGRLILSTAQRAARITEAALALGL